MLLVKDLLGGEHEIVRCTVDMKDAHFNKIKEFIEPENVEIMKKEMSLSIEQGTAFTIKDAPCFFYYVNSSDKWAKANAMYGKGNPKQTIALFYGIFKFIDTKTKRIDMYLHKGVSPGQFQSLVTATSIKNHYATGAPLVARVDLLVAKMDKIYDQDSA